MITKEEAEKLYSDLISLRRSEVLTKSKDNKGQIEIHHILPRSCGGLDVESNKIALYAKEHFMAHVYLWSIYRNTEFHDKVVCALNNMIKGTKSGLRSILREFILASEEYQKAREDLAILWSKKSSEINKGKNNPMYGKHWYYNPQTNEYRPFKEDEYPNGWIRGLPKEKCQKMSKNLPHDSTKGKIQIYNKDRDIVKYILPNEEIPKDFIKGGRPLNKNGKEKLRMFHKKKLIEISKTKINELRPLYSFYKENGWDKFRTEFNYKYSRANFLQSCKKYLEEYDNSQQGKKILTDEQP